MKNKLDQFFKRKLQDRQFDFDEKNWQKMEQLLQKKSKKPKIIWLWLGVLFLSFGLWSTRSFFANTNDLAKENSFAQVKQVSAKQSKENPKKTYAESQKDLQDVENERVVSINVPNSSKKESVQSNQVKPILKTTEHTNKEIERKESSTNKQAQTIHTFNEKNSSMVEKKPKETKATMDAFSLSESQPDDILMEEKLVSKSLKMKDAHTFAPSKEADKFSIKNIKKLSKVVNLLAGEKPVPRIQVRSAKQFRRWQYGVAAETHFEASRTNWKLGVDIRYQLFSNLAIGTGLNYGLQVGYVEKQLFKQDSTFSFGYLIKETYLKPEQGHFIEIPLFATLSIGKQAIIGGVSFRKIVAITGTATTFERHQLNPLTPKLTGTTRGRLPNQAFESFQAKAILGYERRIKKMTFGIRGYYPLSAVLVTGEKNEFSASKASWGLTVRMPISSTFRSLNEKSHVK